MNTERYIVTLRKFWAALGRRRDVNRALQRFQQDEATPHTSNDSMAWLEQHFGNRLISRRLDNPLSAHSPDLNPPDFHLWGYIKDNVYADNLQTVNDIKKAITTKIRDIPRDEYSGVIDDFARRIQLYLRVNGGHLEHIM